MGYRIVRMSAELLEAMMVEGWTGPNANNEIIRCTSGLPEGAKLVDISRDVYFNTNEIALKFSHESWPDLPPGCTVPAIRVEYSAESIQAIIVPAG